MCPLGLNVIVFCCPLQVAKLRSLFSSAENEPPVPLVRNWRPPQPLKGRVVRASFKWALGPALFRKGTCHWRAWLLSPASVPSSRRISVLHTRQRMWDAVTKKPQLRWTRSHMKAFGLCNNHLSYKSSISSKVSKKKKQRWKSKDTEKWLLGTICLPS